MKGYESVSFFGDEFGYNSFDTYIQECPEENSHYVRQHFEVTGFMSNKDNSLDENVISRLRNLLVGAI